MKVSLIIALYYQKIKFGCLLKSKVTYKGADLK